MDAGVGLRAKPSVWAGLGNPHRSSTARVPVSFAAEKPVRSLVLGSDCRSRCAKLKVSCSRKAAGIEKAYYSADEALVLKQKAEDVIPYLNDRCIYLVGMMGSGKTTVGKILAEVLGYSFFDSDKLVEKAVGISSVAEIFQLHSEAFFRDNEKGLTIWLDVPLDALARRIAAVGTASRPLLHQESGDPYAKAYAKLTSLFEQRMDSYANADARVSLEHIAVKQGHNDVTILTPSAIAIEALLKMESFLTEKAMVRN
uniref:Shikimate kinase n=1 Tax=Leersia perrieri TaxID=77586 RepID=A0A0D9WA61_9ORYZ